MSSLFYDNSLAMPVRWGRYLGGPMYQSLSSGLANEQYTFKSGFVFIFLFLLLDLRCRVIVKHNTIQVIYLDSYYLPVYQFITTSILCCRRKLIALKMENIICLYFSVTMVFTFKYLLFYHKMFQCQCIL